VRQKLDTLPTATRSTPEFGRQLPFLRAKLDEQRRFRTEQLEELAVEAAQAVASGDQNRLQVARVLTLAAESALSEIETALQRLADGSYGTCERCAEPIPWDRLKVLPMTRLCTPCQYLAESGRSPRSRDGQTRSGSRIR
jgi:DnaK suppressor protein